MPKVINIENVGPSRFGIITLALGVIRIVFLKTAL